MKKIIDRPVLASIFFMIIIIFGFYSYKNMPIELVPDPEQGLPSLVVEYFWQGASPDMVLKKVLIPSEEEIMQIKGVEKLSSRATQGRGRIDVEFRRNTRMNFANVQLAERLNRLRRELPDQVIGPNIQPQIPEDFRQNPLFRIGIYGANYSIYTLRKLAEKEVLPHLKAVPGIESANMYGGVDPEIKIQTDLARLKRYDVDVRDIQTRLFEHFYNRHSLSFTKDSAEITLSLSENPDRIEDIQDIVMMRMGEKKLFLKDVADVFMGYQELNVERRFQGRSYVQFELYKEPNYSHLETAERVRAKLQYLANKFQGKVEFVIQSDDSKALKRQLKKLGKIAFLILAIIFVILLIIVRDVKSSLLIFSSVFFSVFATLTVVYLFEIPLNLLTLSGLALGFGLFVDNAVVVFDSILRFRERGAGLKESAVEGAKAVILPVLASTFTTIIVFFSFALLFQDRLRIYYLPLAYIIAVSLLSSIVVSFVLIPSLSARIKLKRKKLSDIKLLKKGKFFPFILKYPQVFNALLFASLAFSFFTTWVVTRIFKTPLSLATIIGFFLCSAVFMYTAARVLDSISRAREQGTNLKESIVKGTKAVLFPVLIAISFIIGFFLEGLLLHRLGGGQGFPLYLVYITGAYFLSAILFSFVLVPLLSIIIKPKLKEAYADGELFKRGKFFPFLLKYPLIIILPIVILFVSSYSTFKEEVSFGRFFSWNNQEMVRVQLRFRTGTEFEEIQNAILGFEKVALEKPYKKEINTIIWDRGGYMEVAFPPEIEASAYPIQLKQELVGLATNLAGVGVFVSGFDQEPYYYNPDTGSHLPFNIQIAGYNFERLTEFTENLKASLLKHRRIKDAEVQTDMQFWWGARDKYYAFKLNREKLKNYDMQPNFFLFVIGTVLRESTRAQQLKFDERELFVEIKAADVKEMELDDILNRSLETPRGIPFRVRDVVDIEFSVQKGGITREDQEYKAMVQWDYLGSARSGDRFHKTRYDKLQVPVGFTKSLEERTFRLSEEEEQQLNLAIILSIALIYLILAMLYENFFQPFLIMLAIPLALIGVFIAFVVMDYSFDSTGYIGIILLSGIVVNNAILLIDNINRNLKKSQKIIDAIVIGTKERIRPIFMTTMTTVLGMMPLVIFKESGSGQGDIWSSLALCTVGGLTTSALLLLFVLPIFYYLFYQLQKHLFKAKQEAPAS